MKLFCVTVLSLMAMLHGGQAYNTENDGFPIEKVVADEKSLKDLVGCFLDKAECNDVLTAFKKDMPDAISSACTNCNDRQKEMFYLFLTSLKEKLPQEYEEYQKKYDPEHKHFTTFLTNIKKP